VAAVHDARDVDGRDARADAEARERHAAWRDRRDAADRAGRVSDAHNVARTLAMHRFPRIATAVRAEAATIVMRRTHRPITHRPDAGHCATVTG